MKKVAANFLSLLDEFENYYKSINKKLNANKLSKKVESLFNKKINLSSLLNFHRISNKAKSILNKKIQLPNWLTADSFSKGIRILIKNKFDVTSKSNKSLSRQKTAPSKAKSNKINFNLIVKLNNSYLSLKNNANQSLTKANKKISKNASKVLNKYNLIIKYILDINFIKKTENRKKSIKVDKNSQTIGVAVYSDHLLTVSSLSINQKNQIVVRGVVEVPIPGHIIGDNLVEDKDELANITLDLFNLLGLTKSPLLVILSSSFFKVHTFLASELKQISNTDYTVQAKSPYLPEDTFIEFRSMSKKSTGNRLIRTLYARRKFLESWTDMLEIINVPIIGITPSSPHIFDALTNKFSQPITILIDIEVTSTTVLVGRKSGNLTSYKLPYGCSLYTSEQDEELSNNYFIRVLASIELIMSEYDEKPTEIIYVTGQGLDNLIKKDLDLPTQFRRASEMNLADYSYAPKKMEIHELVSKSIDSTIDTLSCIASSCL